MRCISILCGIMISLAVQAGGIETLETRPRFSFDAAWLYWLPVGAVNDYASMAVLSGTHATVTPLYMDQDYSSGLGLDAVYLFANLSNDIAFSYIHFDKSYKDGPHRAVHGIRTIEVSNSLINSIFYDNTSGDMHYDYDAYELNTAYNLQWQKLAMRWLAGLRYVKLYSDMGAFYSIDNGPVVTHIISSDANALGPTLGVTAQYPLFYDIVFSVTGEAGVLAGSVDMRSFAVNTSGIPFVTALNTFHNRHAAIPFYDIKFALQKSFTLQEDRQVRFRAGYYESYYDKIYVRRSSVAAAEEQSVSFSGPFVSVGLVL